MMGITLQCDEHSNLRCSAKWMRPLKDGMRQNLIWSLQAEPPASRVHHAGALFGWHNLFVSRFWYSSHIPAASIDTLEVKHLQSMFAASFEGVGSVQRFSAHRKSRSHSLSFVMTLALSIIHLDISPRGLFYSPSYFWILSNQPTLGVSLPHCKPCIYYYKHVSFLTCWPHGSFLKYLLCSSSVNPIAFKHSDLNPWFPCVTFSDAWASYS